MTIAAEAGKPVKTARVEAQRCVGTLQFSAVAARTLTGHTVPMEAGAAGEGKLGMVIRVPYGVVGAISPFNFPLNLVAHKLGPAIAAGNAIVLKPAGQTPISAIKLAEVFYDAGLPENWLQVVCGPGSEVGNAIVEDDRISAITFTGSAPVGWGIRSKAPHKKVQPGARLERASDRQRGRRLGDSRRQGAAPRLLARGPELHLGPADPAARVHRGSVHRAVREERRVAGDRRPDGREHRRRAGHLPRRPRPGQGVDRRGGCRRRRDPHRRRAGRRGPLHRPDRDQGRAEGVPHLEGRDLRPGGHDPHLQDLRRGARDGERLPLRPPGRGVHPGRRQREEGGRDRSSSAAC